MSFPKWAIRRNITKWCCQSTWKNNWHNPEKMESAYNENKLIKSVSLALKLIASLQVKLWLVNFHVKATL